MMVLLLTASLSLQTRQAQRVNSAGVSEYCCIGCINYICEQCLRGKRSNQLDSSWRSDQHSAAPLSIPVPNLGAMTSPSETDKKSTGLYVPSGAVIYVGVSAALTAPSSSTRVHCFAQGGFF